MKKLTTLFVLLFLLIFMKMGNAHAEIDESYKWYLDATNASELHKQGIKGKGVKILVIDEGLDALHQEFSNTSIIGHNSDLASLKSSGFPHGTAMTALIAGRTLGIAPDSTIYFYKKLTGDKVTLLNQIDDFQNAIQWGINNNVDIISMSQGYTLDTYALKDSRIMEAHNQLRNIIKTAKDNGILSISATGNINQSDCYDHKNPFKATECTSSEENDKQNELNSQSDNSDYSVHTSSTDPKIDSVTFPAKFPDVVAVGAIRKISTGQYNRSIDWLSQPIPNYPWKWQASGTGESLDVVAPGTNIEFAIDNSYYEDIVKGKSTNTTLQYYFDHSTFQENGSYLNYEQGGTSGATAIAAGIAALIKQLHPDDNAYQLESRIFNMAKKDNIKNDDEYFENQFGSGLVYVDAPLNLIKNVNNWLVYDNTWGGHYGAIYMFDGDEGSYNHTYFPENEFLRYEFEKEVKPHAFKLLYTKPNESHDVRVSLYDKNMELLEKKDISEQGVYAFDRVHDNVKYFEIKNLDSTSGIDLNEFELYGGDYPKIPFIKKINQDINLQENSKFFYENFIIPHWKTDLTGNILHITDGYDWNDKDQQFDKVIGSNSDLGISQYSTSLESNERTPIYQNDLTSKTYGQIVKDATGYMGTWLFDDNWNNLATLNPNQPVSYEFDFPVSISQLYFGLSYKTINNQVQVKLMKDTGEEHIIHLKDKDLFDRVINLGSTYENIKKIEVMNESPSQEVKIYEVGAFGTPNEKEGNDPISIKHTVTLYPGEFKMYNEPNGKETEDYYTANPETKEVSQVYGFSVSVWNYMWMQIEVNGEKKWILNNPNKLSFTPLYEDGALNKTAGSITAAQNDYNFYYSLDESSTRGSLLGNGFGEYTFDSPVTGSNLYIDFNDKLDDSSHQLKVTLYDENNQVIYDKELTRDDLYNRVIPLGATYTNIKKFRVENLGTNEVSIANFEIKE